MKYIQNSKNLLKKAPLYAKKQLAYMFQKLKILLKFNIPAYIIVPIETYRS